MGGSFRIGRIAGIGLYVHWTFLILVMFFFFRFLPSGVQAATYWVVFLLALFGCVLLHELGHALTAKHFGIQTRDITLLPIGGIARLERIPENPTHELIITINGPLVNVAIALVLYLVIAATGGPLPFQPGMDPGAYLARAGLLYNLMVINISLAVFNILPAFPMDGGRILRAILAYFMDYPRATRIAARVGQGMAVLFAIAGLFTGNFILLLIALFVFMGAQAEAQYAQVRSAFTGRRVRDGMMTNFTALSEHDPLSHAVDALLASSQEDFPVVSDTDGEPGRVVGILPRSELFRALSEGGTAAPVVGALRRDCPIVSEDDPLEPVFQKMREQSCPAVPVVRGDRLVGLLTMENLTELLMIQNAVERGHGTAIEGGSAPTRTSPDIGAAPAGRSAWGPPR